MWIDCIFLGGWKDALRQWEKKVDEPPLKVFKPVNSNVPVLNEYVGVLGEEYCGKW